MSKRGKALKTLKTHMMGMVEALEQLVDLPKEDHDWAEAKIAKLEKSFNKRLEDLNKKRFEDDDLPF